MRSWQDQFIADSVGTIFYVVLAAVALAILTSGALAGAVIGAARGHGGQSFPLFSRQPSGSEWTDPADGTGLGVFDDGGLVFGEETPWQ